MVGVREVSSRRISLLPLVALSLWQTRRKWCVEGGEGSPFWAWGPACRCLAGRRVSTLPLEAGLGRRSLLASNLDCLLVLAWVRSRWTEPLEDFAPGPPRAVRMVPTLLPATGKLELRPSGGLTSARAPPGLEGMCADLG